MKKIEVEGHSGCYIDIKKENDILVIDKYTKNDKYIPRLKAQFNKQEKASKTNITQGIIVPKIIKTDESWPSEYHGIMEYVYGKNFVQFFEYADKMTIDKFIATICDYIRNEIESSTCEIEYETDELYKKWESVKKNMTDIYNKDSQYSADIFNIIKKCDEIFKPNIKFENFYVGKCHGDLTFSNIIFRDNEYALIDFLDSFIESPIMDIVKLRQDTKYKWSTLMYNSKEYDKTRYDMICKYIDEQIDNNFKKYSFYNNSYPVFQLMNFLRIIQYAKKDEVTVYLIETINNILKENF